MAGINWEEFGLKTNPYDISPLVEGGQVHVGNAFVGRELEREEIDGILGSEDRACLAICGNVGVGKTSIANYQKYVWKYHNANKPLFSFRREIEAQQSLLNKNNFILEVIGSILREIELLDPKLIEKNQLLQKLTKLVDITQTIGISGNISAGMPGIIDLSATISEKQIIAPMQLTTVVLEKYFDLLLQFILSNKIRGILYKGIIIHVNNFDVVMQTHKKETKQFFAQMRDFMQTKHVYFFFLGPTNFFREIIAVQDRVKSIFIPKPLVLNPLTKEELVSAINKRLKLLQSDSVSQIIKPFEDAVIYEMYEVFSGDVRMVMSALRDILTHYADNLPQTLSLDEAQVILAGERIARVEMQLTAEQLKVLGLIVTSVHPVTQSEIALALNKAPTNVSSYYFKPLAELGIIEIIREEGKHKYWSLTHEFSPLKHLLQAQKNLRERFDLDNALAIFEK